MSMKTPIIELIITGGQGKKTMAKPERSRKAVAMPQKPGMTLDGG